MKTSLTDAMLNILEAGTITTINMVWAMSAAKPESYRRHRSLLLNTRRITVGEKIVDELKVDIKEYRKYHALLSRLSRQGIIESTGTGHVREWFLTRKGIHKLQKAKSTVQQDSLVREMGLTIISYDVPERKRRERGRLRDLLKMTEFEQVHQSLWYGKKKVTKEFLKILKELKVLDCVHIFEVSKTGSLTKVAKVAD